MTIAAGAMAPRKNDIALVVIDDLPFKDATLKQTGQNA
jgi:hypothetical protein